MGEKAGKPQKRKAPGGAAEGVMEGVMEGTGDFGAVRDRITFSLINRERNRVLLGAVPYVEVMDLAMVFFIDRAGEGTWNGRAIVDRECLKRWGTGCGELMRLAAGNTPRLHPPDLRSGDEILREILGEYGKSGDGKEFLEDMRSVPMAGHIYMLSSTGGRYGAAAMVYEGVLKRFADGRKKDLLIIPVDVHGVMVLPWDERIDPEGLRHMLGEMNRKETPSEDVLSDRLYWYQRREDCLIVQGEGPEKGCSRFFPGRMKGRGNLSKAEGAG